MLRLSAGVQQPVDLAGEVFGGGPPAGDDDNVPSPFELAFADPPRRRWRWDGRRVCSRCGAAGACIAANGEEAPAPSPFEVARDRLDTIPGVGKPAAEVIVAKIGIDMTRFPTDGYLAPGPGSGG